jgi:hypothetical protein
VSKTHYEMVGSSPGATAEEVRRSYLKRARQLHPDQFVGRPAAERAKAERRMKDLNAAWTVLSDRDARRAYDAELFTMDTRGTPPIVRGRSETWKPFDPSRPVPPRPKPGPVVADQSEMEITGAARLLRAGPLLLLFGALVTIIVIATFATGGGDGGPIRGAPVVEPTGVPVACLDLASSATVPCGGHDAVVWLIVGASEACPVDLESIYRQGSLYCVTLVE